MRCLRYWCAVSRCALRERGHRSKTRPCGTWRRRWRHSGGCSRRRGSRRRPVPHVLPNLRPSASAYGGAAVGRRPAILTATACALNRYLSRVAVVLLGSLPEPTAASLRAKFSVVRPAMEARRCAARRMHPMAMVPVRLAHVACMYSTVEHDAVSVPGTGVCFPGWPVVGTSELCVSSMGACGESGCPLVCAAVAGASTRGG